MGEHFAKRGFNGLPLPRKGHGPVLRDVAENGDQFCNRLGCNGRLNHTKTSRNTENFKSSRPSFHASDGNEIIGSHNRTCSVVPNSRTSVLKSSKKPCSQPELEVVVSSSTGRGVQIGYHSDAKKFGKDRLTESGSSSVVASNSKPRKVFQKKSGLRNRDTPPLRPSVPLASTCQGAKNRFGLGNFRCNSTSDVVVPSRSSSESEISRRNSILTNGNTKAGNYSSVLGKKITRPSSDRTTSTLGISISNPRRTGNGSPNGNNGIGWSRTTRSMNCTTGTRLSSQRNGNILLPTNIAPHVPHPELPIVADNPSRSHQFSAEASSSHSTTLTCSSSSGHSSPDIMRAGPAELGTTCSLTKHDGLQRYNMCRIAEELLALEVNLFLGGLGFYDRHRDMRLDIDNMSYEELIALEEKMGSVSTALSEEALSKCLQTCIYQPTDGAVECREDKNEGKCSICQEEYVIGDEVGKLDCEHGYHVECIHQWLRLKNWCPVCKGSAATSLSVS